jgi:DNA invertase Pin-like site-specific DNA recombinase
MRILVYIRVSSTGQLDGDGPDRQLAAIKAFAAKHGLEILFIVEEAVSGTVDGMDRPKLSQFLNKNAERNPADAAYFDAVVVERLDRLARDLMVQELLIRELQKLGVKLFATDQGELVDFADACPDPTRKLIRQVLGAVAEFEKTNLVRKLRAARVRKGRFGGVHAFGDNPQEASTLAAMKAMRAEGLSLYNIADRLNEEELPQRNGKPWTAASVSNILNYKKGGDMKARV